MKHTPEPWRSGGHAYWQIQRSDAIGGDTAIAVTTAGTRREKAANARRIAACVNACRGIADPETAVPALVAAARLVAEGGPTDEEIAQATADGREDTVEPWLALRAALADCEPVEDA